MMKKQGEQRPKLAPKLRFKGFTDDWEQRELHELVNFSKGKGYSKKDIVESGTPFMRYGSLYTDFEIEITDIKESVEEQPKSVKSKGGEILVPSSGETPSEIARASTLLKKDVIIGGDINILTVKNNNVLPTFLTLDLNTDRNSKELSKYAVGNSVVHLYNKDLHRLKVYLPGIETQKKIVRIWRTLDKLLTLHKRKIELELKYVEALKESFIPYSEQIQKSFNNIEYRVVKLEDILKERKETNVPNDEYPLVSFTADEGVTKKTERYNREFLVRKSEKKYKKTLYNDLVYNPANLKFGAINRNTFGNAVFSPIYITFTTSQDSEYLEYVFTQWNFINKALKYQEGTVYERSSVKPKDFLKIKLAIPNDINDQKFIASLIDQKLIATNKSKAFLKKLEKLKDYYLKDLFI